MLACCELKNRDDVLGLQVRQVLQDFLSRRPRRKEFQHVCDTDAQAADARSSATHGHVCCDPIHLAQHQLLQTISTLSIIAHRRGLPAAGPPQRRPSRGRVRRSSSSSAWSSSPPRATTTVTGLGPQSRLGPPPTPKRRRRSVCRTSAPASTPPGDDLRHGVGCAPQWVALVDGAQTQSRRRGRSGTSGRRRRGGSPSASARSWSTPWPGNGKQKRDPCGHVKRDPPVSVNSSVHDLLPWRLFRGCSDLADGLTLAVHIVTCALRSHSRARRVRLSADAPGGVRNRPP